VHVDSHNIKKLSHRSSHLPQFVNEFIGYTVIKRSSNEIIETHTSGYFTHATVLLIINCKSMYLC